MDVFYKGCMYLWFVWLFYNSCGTVANTVTPGCSSSAKSCEFYLTLSAHRTMVYTKNTSPHTMYEGKATYDSDGNVTVRHRRKCDEERLISDEEAATIPTADGYFKLAYLFNQSLPGPPIVVYRDQQIIVHVKNALINEGTTVHWHGLEQHNSPWMDGVERLSQCIINPGETFTYSFLANRPGTFWYHTHASAQRTMGAYGPLIIVDRSEHKQNKRRDKDPLPHFDEEFSLMVSDWFVNSSLEIAEIVHYQAFSFLKGWEISNSECFKSTKAPDGMDAGVVPFHSGLINGKGYHYKLPTEKPANHYIPLERFTVEKGKRYRFRMVSAAMTFLFRISIDHHKLHVIATDSSDVVTKVVDYIIISSGERYDFWIEATDPDDLGSYWIRAETLEVYTLNYQEITPNHVEAALHYNTCVSHGDPVSQSTQCTKDSPCLALNCPFKRYGVNPYISCLPVSELRNAESEMGTTERLEVRGKQRQFMDFFLNYHSMLKFAHTSTEQLWSQTINGRQNELPSVPFQIYPETEQDHRKPCRCPPSVFCPCTHMVDIPLGSTVQLVILVTVKNPPGLMNGNPHNVHLHGYRFKVIRTGFPVYDNQTSFHVDHSRDIECDGDFCNRPTWANKSWFGGNVPTNKNHDAPFKDTILIPVGGYAVVQFTANNPGYWYMHCHTEFHNEEGMSMVFKVGNSSEMPPAPDHMFRCESPDWTNTTESGGSKKRLFRRAVPGETEEQNCTVHLLLYRIVLLVFIALTLLLLAMNVYTCKKHTQYSLRGYRKLPTSQKNEALH